MQPRFGRHQQLPRAGGTLRGCENEDLHMDDAAWTRLGEPHTCVWEGEAKLFTLRCNLEKLKFSVFIETLALVRKNDDS